MSTAITVRPGSGSTDGRGIKVTGTNSGGAVTLHTAQASATDFDVIEVTVYNSDTSDRTITFEVGGTTSPDDLRGGTVPAGEERTFYGLMLRNSLVLKAFASQANVLTCFPRVKRIAVS